MFPVFEVWICKHRLKESLGVIENPATVKRFPEDGLFLDFAVTPCQQIDTNVPPFPCRYPTLPKDFTHLIQLLHY